MGRLRQAGHEVFTPTMTGLGERVHLGHAGVGIDTHITDVINVMVYEDLQDVILVGHSYAAVVVQGVADRAPERLTGLVYLDSAPFPDGVGMFDLYSPEGRAETEREIEEAGEGWKLPFPGIEDLGKQASLAGLDDQALELMASQATAQPADTFRQSLSLTREYDGSYTRTLIACTEDFLSIEVIEKGVASGEPLFQPLAASDWTFHELQTGHWPMLSMPAEVTGLLDQVAGASRA
ncbi:alpha/beta hydrolase [soil metagenome]